MAAKTDGSNPWQPLLGADPAGLLELGARLRLRRAALGYRHVPAFTQKRGLNTRMAGDIEHGRRDTYTLPTLQDVAAAYEVTCDSMTAVAWGRADELTPAAAAPVRGTRDRHDVPGPGGVPPAPFDDPEAEADYPYFVPIWQRFLAVAGEGVAVTGALLFPDAPDDAQAWDGIGARLPAANRAWFIARLRRRAAARAAGADSGSHSA